MNIKFFCFLLIAAITLLGNAIAAGMSEGPVRHLEIYYQALILKVGDPINHLNKPSCSTVGDDWVIDLTTDGGKAMYALLLTTYNSGEEVYVYGSGACAGPLSDREQAIQVLIRNH